MRNRRYVEIAARIRTRNDFTGSTPEAINHAIRQRTHASAAIGGIDGIRVSASVKLPASRSAGNRETKAVLR
jgi:hypothetical protein